MLKALIVDDEADIRLLLSAMLEKHDFEVHSAESISQSLQIIGQSDGFNAAFLDIKLPDGTGWELIPSLRDKFERNIYITMVSAFDEEAKKVKLAAADQFISKPFDSREVERIIQTVIQ